MKKLSKLKLKEFHEMSDFEMRNVVGGHAEYTESSWYSQGEYLFYCMADFVGPTYGDPETTVELGAVCARTCREASQKVRETLSKQGVESFGVSCR
ncbi:TIGR04149 family rSAM-modified RiPP [Bacteroides sp. AN502(2024)]|uniref:TIGR04149 family rSAM-modified RiPP n=1 Tax=Bacteroides sp. AN502(2024) TaxID=3160599 RepID=UPI0035112040